MKFLHNIRHRGFQNIILSFIKAWICIIGPILDDDMLKEKFLKPWKGVLCVCLSVGYRAHILTKEPNFWVEWSLGHEKETHFFLSKFSFLRFL